MTENKLNTQPNYTYEEIMKAIGKLEPNEKEAVLNSMKINDIKLILESKHKIDEYCGILKQYADLYNCLGDSLQKLYVNISVPTEVIGDIVDEYKDLSVQDKKTVALELLNNGTFQKDCCDILVKDFERIIKENPTLKAINDAFKITDWYKKNIALGIGCDHKYKVD